MKNKLSAIIIAAMVFIGPRSAKAALFGGDVVVLTQILAQAIQTLITLKNVLENGKDTLDLMRDINAGVRSGILVTSASYDFWTYATNWHFLALFCLVLARFFALMCCHVI